MRGEKKCGGVPLCSSSGSPPLARGKDVLQRRDDPIQRITPACAGKRYPVCFPGRDRQDHPRLRGEKCSEFLITKKLLGSPPLARGKARRSANPKPQRGITPACAGKRIYTRSTGRVYQDHPRLRGEKQMGQFQQMAQEGSPPLARGKAGFLLRSLPAVRITPACAGKRLKKSKNTYDPKCPISAFHSVFQTQQMSGDNPQAHDAMQKRPFRSGMRVSSIYNPKQGQVFFLPIEAYRHRGF